MQMMILPRTWHDLVTLRIGYLGWRWVRSRDLRLPVSIGLVIIGVKIVSLGISDFMVLRSLYNSDSDVAYEYMQLFNLFQLAPMLIYCGVMLLVFVQHVRYLKYEKYGVRQPRGLWKATSLAISLALVSIAGLVVYSDNQLYLLHLRAMQVALVLLVSGLLLLCTISDQTSGAHQARIVKRLAAHAPLALQAVITLSAYCYYTSTLGNWGGVIM